MKKLTLSADAKLIRQAHKLARESGTSLSAMFERFVRLLVRRRGESPPPGPITRKASGLARLPRGRTARAVLEDALLDRHGLKR
jgi:hypothetical protein